MDAKRQAEVLMELRRVERQYRLWGEGGARKKDRARDADRALLYRDGADALERMRALLLRLERSGEEMWQGDVNRGGTCPICGNVRCPDLPSGHATDCALWEALGHAR